jgi:hypothetical protein
VPFERLRAGTSFRVTFNGQAQGPAGSAVRTALLRAGEEVSTPKTACQDWNGCRRGTSDPGGTRWSVSVIALTPVPTHVTVAVMPEGAAPATPYATQRVELDCPRF